MEIQFSKHAKEQMIERGISDNVVLDVVQNPGQQIQEGQEKVIYQGIRYFDVEERNFLVRVFVNIIKEPNLIITVYRTSKIEKYYEN